MPLMGADEWSSAFCMVMSEASCMNAERYSVIPNSMGGNFFLYFFRMRLKWKAKGSM